MTWVMQLYMLFAVLPISPGELFSAEYSVLFSFARNFSPSEKKENVGLNPVQNFP